MIQVLNIKAIENRGAKLTSDGNDMCEISVVMEPTLKIEATNFHTMYEWSNSGCLRSNNMVNFRYQ